jgi:hypothetical protein
MRLVLFTAFIATICLHALPVLAQPGPDEDAMVASSVCQGALFEITRAQGGKISANVGQYKIEGANGSVTISKGERSIISGMTYDLFTKCLIEMKRQIAADRKASRIQRQSEIFEVTLDLSTTLNMGTCLLGAAQVGLYIGDMSQGAGTVTGEEATRRRLDVLETEFREKARRLFQRDLQLGLTKKVNFFRFIQGKSVPYFDSTTIGEANSLISPFLAGEEQIVGSLGRDIGMASNLAHYFAVLPAVAQMVAQQDPPQGQFLFPGVQQSQQCILALYPDVARRVQSEFSAFRCSVSVPQLSNDHRSTAWKATVDATRACIQNRA